MESGKRYKKNILKKKAKRKRKEKKNLVVSCQLKKENISILNKSILNT